METRTPIREKLVRILMKGMTEEQAKEKMLKIIDEKGYRPVNVLWRIYTEHVLYDTLECYFDIEK